MCSSDLEALEELQEALAACPDGAKGTKEKILNAISLLEKQQSKTVMAEDVDALKENKDPSVANGSSNSKAEKQETRMQKYREKLRSERALHKRLADEVKGIREALELLEEAKTKVDQQSVAKRIGKEEAIQWILRSGEFRNDHGLTYADLVRGREQFQTRMEQLEHDCGASAKRQEELELRISDLELELIQTLTEGMRAGKEPSNRHPEERVLQLVSSLQAKQQAKAQCTPSVLAAIQASQFIQKDNDSLRAFNSRLKTENRYLKASKLALLENTFVSRGTTAGHGVNLDTARDAAF